MKKFTGLLLVIILTITAHLNLQAQTLTVTSGLQLWLNADSVNTADPTQVVSQNGTYYVSKWVDQSGSGNNAIQSGTGRQPAYVPATLNGHAVLRFDGVNDTLTTSLQQIAGNKSIFIVQKRMDTQLRAEISSTSITSGMFFANVGGNESEGRLYTAQDLQLPGLVNEYILKSYIRSGTTATLAVNDGVITGNAPDVANGDYTISDGYSFPYAGVIAEILIYNRAVTDVERQSIENYLSEKYALWDPSLPVRSGLQLWLSADAINSNTAYQIPQVRLSGSNIYTSVWVDRSANGDNATQATTANQPLLLQNYLNGRPVVQFNGVNNYLSTKLAQIAGDKTIFVVHERTSASQIGTEISSSAGYAGHFLGNSGTFETKGRLDVAQDLALPDSLGQYIIKSYVRSGTTETLQVGDSTTTGTAPDVAQGSYLISDKNWPFPGNIAEVLVYNRALSGTEQATVGDYLEAKWSNLPQNIFSIAPDVTPPPMTTGTPAPGVRVQQTTPVAPYIGTSVYHTLYLPTNWQPGHLYPVIVEYSPNGGYTDSYGDTTTGNVQDDTMGYGLSGGTGYIWICMPTVGGSPLSNQTQWWGTVTGTAGSTEDYCLKTIQYVCQNYGGDPSAVILTGYSRGGIACNYIGLYDANIADTWLAFMPHSGYDGQYTTWPYSGADDVSALVRLQRLNGRAQHISQDTAETSPQSYLIGTGVNLSQFAFRTLPYVNHTGAWPERAIQLRRDARYWLNQVVTTRPGTYSIQGHVANAHAVSITGALIQSGATHFTYSDSNGNYVLAGLINSARTLSVTASGYTFTSQSVTISGSNVLNINFQSQQ